MAENDWPSELDLGIEAIDADHRKLFDLMNRLLAAGQGPEGEHGAEQALGELIQISQSHFAREEKMLKDAHYPDLSGHQMEHREMKERLKEIKIKMLHKGPSHLTSARVVAFLEAWLYEHIQNVDRRYADYFRKNGVTPQPE